MGVRTSSAEMPAAAVYQILDRDDWSDTKIDVVQIFFVHHSIPHQIHLIFNHYAHRMCVVAVGGDDPESPCFAIQDVLFAIQHAGVSTALANPRSLAVIIGFNTKFTNKMSGRQLTAIPL